MVELYDNLQEMLEAEIEKIVKSGQITQSSLCNLDTLVDIAKDVEEIKTYQDKGYSGRRGVIYNNSYYDDRRDGRYMKYEGDIHYSNTGSKEHMLSLMRDAMNNATTQEEHDEIMKMIKKMENN